METQNISPCKNIIFQKKSFERKENKTKSFKILELYNNNLKFQHKPKKYHLSKKKNPHIKIGLLIKLGDKIP
jgi:hypothetical protein